jgi:hypothetical protein
MKVAGIVVMGLVVEADDGGGNVTDGDGDDDDDDDGLDA